MRPLVFLAAGMSSSACLLLSGCCWEGCVGTTTGAYAHFEFSADTLAGGGFRQAALRTAYVVSYRDDRLTQPLDTLRYPPTTGHPLTLVSRRAISLPFSGDSVWGRPVYYRIVVPAAGQQFAIRHVGLRQQATKCDCNYTTGLSYTLNGQLFSNANPNPALADVVVLRR